MPTGNGQLPDSLQGKALASRRWFRRGLIAFAFVFGPLLISIPFPSITENIGQSSGLRGTVLLAVSSAALLFGKICLNKWIELGAPVDNYKRSMENKAALERLLAAHRPYGIYLRDFLTESMPIDSPFAGGTGEIAMDMLSLSTVREDPVEDSLVKQLGRHLPFYALLNVEDINDRPIAYRIYSDDDNWFDLFVRYAGSAALFIVNIDYITSAITQELDWILQEERVGRVLLVAPSSVIEQVRHRYPGFDARHWVVERDGRKGGWGCGSVKAPGPVLEFVRPLALKSAVVARPLSVMKNRFLKAIGNRPESSPTRPFFVIDKSLSKSESKVTCVGQVRKVGEVKRICLEIWTKNKGLPPETVEFFEHEMLFSEGESEYWLPVRKEFVDKIAGRWKEGDTVIIQTVLAGVVFQGGSDEWLFLVGEFE